MGDFLLQRCGSCKTDKPLDAFSPSYRGKPGAWCRGCFNAYGRGDWKPTTHAPRACQECGDSYVPKQIKAAAGGDFCSKRCRRAFMRKRDRAADPATLSAWDRQRNLQRLYGADAAEWYEATFAAQDGRCVGCGKTPDEGGHLQIDHDHGCCPDKKSCGKCRRALLCLACNRGTGMLGDDPWVFLNLTEVHLLWQLREDVDLSAQVAARIDAIRKLLTAPR